MKRTLLLAFIHGFKGTDDTFEKFPEHFQILLSDALPKINVVTAVYPQYETRGDLTACVASFKEWPQNQVIDLEVLANTPSPTVDPSVRVILIGHSMGGIVAAETLLSIAREHTEVPRSSTPPPGIGNSTTSSTSTKSKNSKASLAVPDRTERSSSAPPRAHKAPSSNPNHGSAIPPDDIPTLLFPYIQGILGFDTPYLGIHLGVIAHGAEAHYNTASQAYSAYTQASKMFGFGNNSAAKAVDASKALPAPNGGGGGGGWGRYAMYAGGVAALAAAGSAAWMGRSQLTEGWSWAVSHLEFVGCLARGAELTQRLDAVVLTADKCHIGFANFYNRLGHQGDRKDYSGKLLGEERTFCVLPKEKEAKHEALGESPPKKRKIEKRIESKGTWVECVNKKVDDEISAHRSMFTIRDFPGYYSMCDKAKEMVAGWVDTEWYESSDGDDEGREKGESEQASEKLT